MLPLNYPPQSLIVRLQPLLRSSSYPKAAQVVAYSFYANAAFSTLAFLTYYQYPFMMRPDTPYIMAFEAFISLISALLILWFSRCHEANPLQASLNATFAIMLSIGAFVVEFLAAPAELRSFVIDPLLAKLIFLLVVDAQMLIAALQLSFHPQLLPLYYSPCPSSETAMSSPVPSNDPELSTLGHPDSHSVPTSTPTTEQQFSTASQRADTTPFPIEKLPSVPRLLIDVDSEFESESELASPASPSFPSTFTESEHATAYPDTTRDLTNTCTITRTGSLERLLGGWGLGRPPKLEVWVEVEVTRSYM
ncbi:hypothetical protein DL93DRAFT_2170797 [Clavulina sp. PMI_390]|nr:hypothetical protein DL93DRAFT_2170797 [Clavulina sp. PMI_390]